MQLTEELGESEKSAGGFFEGDPAISADYIYRCIQNLPPMTATVFNLYAMDGYLHKEIAKMLRIKEGTSKWHYSEARRRLRSQLENKVRKGVKEKLRR